MDIEMFDRNIIDIGDYLKDYLKGFNFVIG